jgi:SAM-dependent methyltransferase
MPDSAGDPVAALLGPDGEVRRWARRPVSGAVAEVAAEDAALVGRGRDSADGAVLLLALHRCPDPAGLLADVRHVLRPGGTLVVVTPSVVRRTVGDLRWSGALRPVRRGPWRHRSALDGAGWLLAAADFAVLTDDRRAFTVPLPDAATARRAVDALIAAGCWPALGPVPRARVTDALAGRAGAGRALPLPLRRLVARR